MVQETERVINMADEMKPPIDVDPANYDAEKLLNDPNWKQPGPDDFELETGATEEDNILRQADPRKWMRRPPKKSRGDMVMALKVGAEADKYKCTCWNTKCPFHGQCRKCIAFHMELKQIPTCQRDMVIEMIKEGYLEDELYMEEER